MYTLLELQTKTFGELKKIGHELNVFPAGDRRRRQSWIDALTLPPLLQLLLEISPGVEVDRAQEPIIETVEASPAAEVEPDPVPKGVLQVAKTSPGVEVNRVPEPIV